MLHAQRDPRLSARVVRRVPLRYRDGADPVHDRPAHVRAASGLTWWRGRLAVVSDDASFVGLIDPATGLTDAVTLPHAPGQRRQFDARRGNKADKLDLESVCAIGDALVAFGSDSGKAVRRAAVVIDAIDAAPRLVELPRLYAALRQPVLGGGVLNVEAAAVVGDRLVLGNRGGDVGADGHPTVDAVVELDLAAVAALLAAPATAPVPAVAWEPLALGALDLATLHLTELQAAAGMLWFAATAEATASAYDDGAVTGSAIGVIDRAGDGDPVRWAQVLDEDELPLQLKIEGLAAGPDGRLLASVDADDPDRASDLLELALDGPWTRL